MKEFVFQFVSELRKTREEQLAEIIRISMLHFWRSKNWSDRSWPQPNRKRVRRAVWMFFVLLPSDPPEFCGVSMTTVTNDAAQLEEKAYLEPGWTRAEGRPLPTFTTARPSPTPLKRPAGLKGRQDHERARWKNDLHSFPPYQHKDCNCVKNSKGEIRIPFSTMGLQ